MNKNRKTLADRIISVTCTILIIFFCVIFLYPLVYIVIASVSPDVSHSGLLSFPEKISLAGYNAIFSDENIWNGLKNSVIYTATGTLISLMLSILSAYVMSQPDYLFGKIFIAVMIIRMYFNGGMIPTYLLIKQLGMLNSMWALILPSSVSVYNIFLLRMQFETKIPREIYDAARIDGCGHFRFLFFFTVPLSKGIISVISLFYTVSYWNTYFNATLYISDPEKLPLTNVLRDLLIKNRLALNDIAAINQNPDVSLGETLQMLDYGLIVVSTVPIFIFMFIIRKALKEYNKGKYKTQK